MSFPSSSVFGFVKRLPSNMLSCSSTVYLLGPALSVQCCASQLLCELTFTAVLVLQSNCVADTSYGGENYPMRRHNCKHKKGGKISTYTCRRTAGVRVRTGEAARTLLRTLSPVERGSASLSPLWEPGCHPGDLVGGLRPPAATSAHRNSAKSRLETGPRETCLCGGPGVFREPWQGT